MWQPRRRAPRALTALIGFAVLYGLWLLLVETFAVSELLAGVAAALLSVLAAMAALQREHRFVSGLTAERSRLWKLPVRMVQDSVVVLRSAIVAGLRGRRAAGAFREIPYDAAGDGPDAAGRRAVTIAVQSFTPNTCVLGFDTERKLIVVHQLAQTSPTRPRGSDSRGSEAHA